MQREIATQVDLGKNVSAFDSIGRVPAIDKKASDLDTVNTKVSKLKKLVLTGEYDADLARYIPGTLELAFQGMLNNIKTMKQVAHPSYKDLETFDFNLMLDKNLYTNLNSVHFVFLIKLKKRTNINMDIATDLITVNRFFAHWIKEISITMYGTNIELIPTSTPQEIYQYSDSMLKHLPPDSLAVIQSDLLYSQKGVNLGTNDRHPHYSLAQENGSLVSEENFNDSEAKFRNQLKNKYVYRVPLKYICDLGKINFPTKIDIKIRLTLEADIKKLFESDANLNSGLKTGKTNGTTNLADYNIAAAGSPGAQIVLLKAPMIQYEQLTLDTTFRQYLKTILYSARSLRMGVQKTPYQKTYEIQAGSQDFTVDFQGANRQFDWIEISLVHDKSDKHLTFYDSYNSDFSNDLHKHLLYKQILAWNTNGCSTASLGDFMNDPVVQKLKKETKYFASDSEERLYIDLRQAKSYTKELEKPKRSDTKMTITIETKNALTHKMRLRV